MEPEIGRGGALGTMARRLRTEKLSRKRVESKIADDLFREGAYHSEIRDGFARLACAELGSRRQRAGRPQT